MNPAGIQPVAPPSNGTAQMAMRPTGPALRRGWWGRCPACGEGRLFSSYLKVHAVCPHCHEDLHHQRADDGPAYLTILFVSHLVGPILLWWYVAYRPQPMTMLLTFCIGAIVLSLVLLPRVKGAMIGVQWARRMHGFGDPRQA